MMESLNIFLYFSCEYDLLTCKLTCDLLNSHIQISVDITFSRMFTVHLFDIFLLILLLVSTAN